MTLYTLVGFALHQFLILPSFLQLEDDEARKDMRRCLRAFDGQLDQIDLLCFDWAAWDDTYEFIETQDEEYLESNLIPESFLDNEINFMYFFRKDGTLAWGKFYDLNEGAAVPFPDFAEQRWAATHLLLSHAGRSSVVQGVVRSSLGLLLIVSRPILPSEADEGEIVRGTMLMGRLLDERIVNAIREQTQVAVDILDVVRDGLPAEAADLAPDEIRILPDGEAVLRVLTHTHDIYGADALLFQVTVPRTILARGRSAIRLEMLGVAIGGSVFLVMLLLSLKWVVTDPLHRLSTHVKHAGLTLGMEPIDIAARRDEIGEVAREFGNMMNRLHEEESELVAAEAALRMSEARVKTILDTAPDAMVILDQSTCIESANEAASQLFGYAPHTFPGMAAASLFSERCRASWQRDIARYLASGETFKFTADTESEGIGADGSVFPIHLSMSSMRLEGELFFICAIRDISGFKSMQEKVARNQHLARIGEMGATVAHEIRNPLAGIKGALQILGTTEFTSDEGKETVREVHELVDRIAHTVEQLLRYAKPITPKCTEMLLRPMIVSITEHTPQGARLSVSCPDSLALNADPALMRQVLENIWRNACQALVPGGRLIWHAARFDGQAVITLTNDGPPVSEADLPHLFEPFYTSRVDGSGLGLAVSHRIVEAHGGTIELRNAERSGVTVFVRIPSGE